MPFNGSGAFSLIYNWQNDAAQNLNISSSRMEAQDQDIASGLSLCITKDGQQTPIANLPMGGFRFTNMGNASVAGNATSLTDVQNATLITLTNLAGTDTITGTVTPAIGAYAAGQSFEFTAAGANSTNAVTLNINSLGAKSVMKMGPTALVQMTPGDFETGQSVRVRYDGTQFQVISPLAPVVPTPFINRVRNGNFDIWQRGTSFVNQTSQFYSADCWQSYRSGAATGLTASQIAGPTGSRYAIRTQRANGDASTASLALGTSWETADVIKWQGKTITLSFQARGNGNLATATLASIFSFGTGTDGNAVGGVTGVISSPSQNNTLAASYQIFTQTVSVPSNATQMLIAFVNSPTGTAGASDWFDIAQVQVNEGASAAPFERRIFADELRVAQRYYETGNYYFAAYGNASIGAAGNVFYKVTKRVAATLTLNNTTSLNVSSAPINLNQPDQWAFLIQPTAQGGYAYYGTWAASSDL